MLLLCRLKVLLTRQYFALEDENLDPDETVCGHGFSKSIIDIGAEGMQRNPALTIPFRTRHLSTTKSAGTGNPDTLGAEFESGGHAFLHGPAEGDPAFKLKGYVLSYKLSIKLRLANLIKKKKNLFGSERRKLLLYGFNFRPFFTDDQAWSGSMNVDFDFIRSPLNLYL